MPIRLDTALKKVERMPSTVSSDLQYLLLLYYLINNNNNNNNHAFMTLISFSTSSKYCFISSSLSDG